MSNGMYHQPSSSAYAQQRNNQTTATDPRLVVSNQFGGSAQQQHSSNSQAYGTRYQDVGPHRIAVPGVVNGYGSRYEQEQTDRRDYTTTGTTATDSRLHHRADPPAIYGSSEQYLSANSVGNNHTAPTSAASIAGYRSMPEDAQYNGAGMNKGYATGSLANSGYGLSTTTTTTATGGERPYVPRHLQHPPTRDSSASGLPALVSASQVVQTFERRQATTATPSSSLVTRRADYHPPRQALERTNNTAAPASSISPQYTPARVAPETASTNQNRTNRLVPPARRSSGPTQTFTLPPRATATSISPVAPSANTSSHSSRTANAAPAPTRLGQTWVGERNRAEQPLTSSNESSSTRYANGSSQHHLQNPIVRPTAGGHVPVQEDDVYPVAPSPAYDPFVFERIIGLSDEAPAVETPWAYKVVETESDRRAQANGTRSRDAGADKEKDQAVHAARHGISPSLLKNAAKKGDSTRLQALVRATEPGQLETWNQQTGGEPPVSGRTQAQEEGSEQDAGNGSEPHASGNGEGFKRVRVRKPEPKKGEPGWVSRRRRTKAELEADAAAKVAAAEAALQAEKEAAAGPFNSLTAHVAAYTQRDKALLREGAGYGKIRDLTPQEILVKQREAAVREAARAAEEKRKEEARLAREAKEEARAAREEARAAREKAQRLALLEGARPAENDGRGALMDIDLSGFGDIDAEIDEEADYEAQRQARIAHNNRIMAALGLGEIFQPLPEESQPRPSKRGRGRPPVKVPKRKREPRYSPDGTTADPCPIGQRQRLAYIELPHVFRSQRVQDLFRYSQLPPVPENPIESETESEDEPFEVAATASVAKIRPEKLPPVHYSQLDGDPCHQCRRKSTKPKMSCRNKDPQCNLKYCNTCVQRYNFPFEEYSRTFICPRCQGYCNCSSCLRSSGLLKLLKLDENQDKLRMSLNAAKTAPNIQVYLETMGAPKAPPMPQEELHRIRFIHKDEDIVTPEIPDDVLSELMARHHKRKHYAKAGVGPKRSQKKAKTKSTEGNAEANQDQTASTVRPQPRKRKGKEKADGTVDDQDAAIPETTPHLQVYAEQTVPEDSDDLSDDEEAEYAEAHNRYTPQYDYGTGDARRPAASALDRPEYQDQHYAIANAWSVYRA